MSRIRVAVVESTADSRPSIFVITEHGEHGEHALKKKPSTFARTMVDPATEPN